MYTKKRTAYVGWADDNPNVFCRSKTPGCSMALLRSLVLDGDRDVAAGVGLGLGTMTAGWPGAPSWTS